MVQIGLVAAKHAKTSRLICLDTPRHLSKFQLKRSDKVKSLRSKSLFDDSQRYRTHEAWIQTLEMVFSMISKGQDERCMVNTAIIYDLFIKLNTIQIW